MRRCRRGRDRIQIPILLYYDPWSFSTSHKWKSEWNSDEVSLLFNDLVTLELLDLGYLLYIYSVMIETPNNMENIVKFMTGRPFEIPGDMGTTYRYEPHGGGGHIVKGVGQYGCHVANVKKVGKYYVEAYTFVMGKHVKIKLDLRELYFEPTMAEN